jgi:hypothetical protein
MKKVIAALMLALFLGTTGLVLADTTTTAKTTPVKHHKRKHKTALNPQPLPPRKIPVDGMQSGKVDKPQ